MPLRYFAQPRGEETTISPSSPGSTHSFFSYIPHLYFPSRRLLLQPNSLSPFPFFHWFSCIFPSLFMSQYSPNSTHSAFFSCSHISVPLLCLSFSFLVCCLVPSYTTFHQMPTDLLPFFPSLLPLVLPSLLFPPICPLSHFLLQSFLSLPSLRLLVHHLPLFIPHLTNLGPLPRCFLKVLGSFPWLLRSKVLALGFYQKTTPPFPSAPSLCGDRDLASAADISPHFGSRVASTTEPVGNPSLRRHWRPIFTVRSPPAPSSCDCSVPDCP